MWGKNRRKIAMLVAGVMCVSQLPIIYANEYGEVVVRERVTLE